MGFFFLFCTNTLSLISPYLLKLAVDSLRSGLSQGKLIGYACAIVGATVVQGGFRYGMRITLIGLSRWIEYDFRNEIFSVLLEKSPGFYHRNSTGDLMSRATEDLNAVRMAVGPGIMHFFSTMIIFIATGIIMLKINVRLTLYALLPLPLVSLIVRGMSSRLHHKMEEVQINLSKVSSSVQESLSGIRVFRAYVREGFETGRFEKRNLEYVKKNLDLARIWGLFLPLMIVTTGLGVIVVVYLGGSLVARGKITLGDFVAFSAYLTMLTFPVMALGWVVNLYQRGKVAMDRLETILEQPSLKDPPQPEKIADIKGEIVFKGVEFHYETRPEQPVLGPLDLTVPAGTTLGILGTVGAGKSSLVNLLPRLAEPSRGEILLDGVDIRRFSLKDLRKQFGYVPQDSFLYSDSMEKNISFGIEEPDKKALRQAAELAGIAPDIEEFGDGYQTLVGEKGITLSGGQRQRTALARALITDPRVLILDDVFSSVDTHTEEQIKERLKKFMQGRTCLIISHRISTIKEADQIIVMDKGKIVQRGTHQELAAASGIYRHIFEQQQLLEEIEGLSANN
ncbi:MAG: ABC transporter ATP-binding protein [bacterium]